MPIRSIGVIHDHRRVPVAVMDLSPFVQPPRALQDLDARPEDRRAIAMARAILERGDVDADALNRDHPLPAPYRFAAFEDA